MSDNTEEFPELTPEEIQRAMANFDKLQAEMELDNDKATSQNVANALEAKKAVQEQEKLQSEFKKFVEEMPRRTKRNLFPQKKFGNVIMDKFRQQRVTNQKHK
jgi:hypothetical protein